MGKSIKDFSPEDLYKIYPESVYEINTTDSHVVILLRNKFDGNDIFSLLEDFAKITPYRRQLSPDILEEIGAKIKGKPLSSAVELANKNEYTAFRKLDLPYYLYWTPVPVGDAVVYSRTMVSGIVIGLDYNKMEVEDDTEPFEFLTYLLRYRLKDNPLAPALLAYLAV